MCHLSCSFIFFLESQSSRQSYIAGETFFFHVASTHFLLELRFSQHEAGLPPFLHWAFFFLVFFLKVVSLMTWVSHTLDGGCVSNLFLTSLVAIGYASMIFTSSIFSFSDSVPCFSFSCWASGSTDEWLTVMMLARFWRCISLVLDFSLAEQILYYVHYVMTLHRWVANHLMECVEVVFFHIFMWVLWCPRSDIL